MIKIGLQPKSKSLFSWIESKRRNTIRKVKPHPFSRRKGGVLETAEVIGIYAIGPNNRLMSSAIPDAKPYFLFRTRIMRGRFRSPTVGPSGLYTTVITAILSDGVKWLWAMIYPVDGQQPDQPIMAEYYASPELIHSELSLTIQDREGLRCEIKEFLNVPPTPTPI